MRSEMGVESAFAEGMDLFEAAGDLEEEEEGASDTGFFEVPQPMIDVD